MSPIETIDPVEAGRSLGHDFHRLSRVPWQASWPSAVQEGFAAAAALRGHRPRVEDRFVRKWLQLRLGAVTRGLSVAPDVTVDLLRRLDVSHCPVTREPLTHATLQGSDASVDRLNNEGAYAASNLAMMSTRANKAKGALNFDAVWAHSRRTEPTSELTPAQWLRLAALMLGPAYVTSPLDVPALPLCVPLPSTSVRTALQQVQRLLTLSCSVAAERNRLLRALLPACPTATAEMRLRHLADRVHMALKRLAPHELIWDAWLQPGPMEALAEWRGCFDAPAWAQMSWAAGQVAGGKPVHGRDLEPWRLSTRGCLPLHRRAGVSVVQRAR